MWSGAEFLGLQGRASLAAIALTTAAAMAAWLGLETPILRGIERVRSESKAGGGWPLAALAPRLDGPIAIAFGTAVIAAVVLAVADFPAHLASMVDRDNDVALAAAAQSEGLLLPGPGLDRIQLRTRRPVLLDPEALDMLPYAADGGFEIARILDEVYGIDFFHPPRSALHQAVVPDQPVRRTWQQRSEASWSAIRERFGVSHVLVKPEWRLRLPEVARSESYALYRIPESVVLPSP
jgi:hypothetical protein